MVTTLLTTPWAHTHYRHYSQGEIECTESFKATISALNQTVVHLRVLRESRCSLTWEGCAEKCELIAELFSGPWNPIWGTNRNLLLYMGWMADRPQGGRMGLGSQAGNTLFIRSHQLSLQHVFEINAVQSHLKPDQRGGDICRHSPAA